MQVGRRSISWLAEGAAHARGPKDPIGPVSERFGGVMRYVTYWAEFGGRGDRASVEGCGNFAKKTPEIFHLPQHNIPLPSAPPL